MFFPVFQTKSGQYFSNEVISAAFISLWFSSTCIWGVLQQGRVKSVRRRTKTHCWPPTRRWITAKKPKNACHSKLYRLRTDDGNNNDKKNNSLHNQGKNGTLVIHFLPSSGAFYRAPEHLATVLPFSFLTWLRSLTQWVCATGQEKKEDGKTFVCDKRDRAITCMFFSDLHLN